MIADKLGIWLFTSSNGPGVFRPSPVTIDSGGLVEFQDMTLVIKQQGTYEPSNVWKGPKSSTTPSSSFNSAPSPASSTDGNLRSVHGLNARAQYNNIAAGWNKETATVSNTVKAESSPTEALLLDRDIKERFITAVLATLNYHMCYGGGFIPLNARTLVLPLSEVPLKNGYHVQGTGSLLSGQAMFLVTLDVHLTSNGTLAAKAWPNAPIDFSCVLKSGLNFQVSDIVEGASLFLSPGGTVARYRKLAEHEDLDTPEDVLESSSFTNSSMAQWKSNCIGWLGNKGIRTDNLKDTAWVLVQIIVQAETVGASEMEVGLWASEERLITLLWPASLCYHRTPSNTVENKISNITNDYDPLSFAEEWFKSNVSRDATMAKRKKDREIAAATAKAQAEVDSRALAPLNNSPVALRRASIAGAVYPTPPDGIQPTVGATPSFDGNVSTPGHPHTQPLATDATQAVVPKGETEDAENSLWDPNDNKRHGPNSSLDFNDDANDNLFGDMDGDPFGENDVTDADFSFFDEPDAVEGTQPRQMNDDDDNDEIVQGDTLVNSNTTISNNNHGSGINPDVPMTETQEDQRTTAEAPHVPENDSDHLANDEIGEMASLPDPKALTAARRPSSPLSPENIFKRLSIVSPHTTEGKSDSNRPGRKISAFGGVEFSPSLSSFNRKYGAHGPFIYPSISVPPSEEHPIDLPKTVYLYNRRKKRKALPLNIMDPALMSPKILVALESNAPDSHSDAESPNYSHMTSPMSDQDDTSNTTEDVPVVFNWCSKRKRGMEDTDETDEEDDIASSLQDLSMDREDPTSISEPLHPLDFRELAGDPAEWSLARFLASAEPRCLTGSFTDVEYISSAQVLADQAIYGTLQIPFLSDEDNEQKGVEKYRNKHHITSIIQQKLTQAMQSCFVRTTECTMSTLLEIQDIYPVGQINRMPPRPMPTPTGSIARENTRPTAMFQIPPSRLEVCRAETRLALLPSAVPFWDTLGLAPCKGSKDVLAICIYPNGNGMSDNVDAFLDHTRSAYESGRFGSHERFAHGNLADGHVAMDFGSTLPFSVADHQANLLRIKETATKLGGLLATSSATKTNIVIYYVYDANSPELLPPICAAFHTLFGVYKDGLAEEKSGVANELVLQLVSLSFLASHTSLVIPTPSEYARLAMEVYDRCVDPKIGTPVPSIVLEQQLPRVIDFKLTPNPSASPMQENSCMHVAYAQSLDDRWVTAAWTDNTGTQQMTASYCLGLRNAPLTTPLNDIAHEIWETTLEMISTRKVSWRIMIAKCGTMEPSEIDFWKALAMTESSAQISLTLITVDTHPSLKLLPPHISIPPNILNTQSSVYTTPVSTPQASIVSPEQSGNATTPARDTGIISAGTPSDFTNELKIDADATLVDVTDQTWGVVLSYRLNNSRSLLEFNPTLASGYLIKRSGAAAADPPVVVEVNIVHSEANPRLYDGQLREILSLYRGFATLARVRGCVDPLRDGRPWHIAAAEKGVKALYMLM